MKNIYTLLVFLISSLYSPLTFAQDDEVEITDSTSGVVIHSDPRLDILMASNIKVKKAYATTPGKSAKVIRSGRGFRVQIYVGNNKNTAISKKVDFMRRYPGVKSYMTYTQPQFRVKVGDFQSRRDAQVFLSEVKSLYPTSMIVPDYIVINTFKKQ